MKKYLEKFITKKQQTVKELRDRMNASEDINEVRSIGEQIRLAQEEIEEARAKLAECSTGLGNARAELEEGEEEQQDGGDDDGEEELPPDDNARARNFRPGRQVAAFDMRGNAQQTRAMEARAKAFAATNRGTITNDEMRATMVSGGKIATPTQVGDFNEPFTQVSSIVDMVHVEDCTGMGTYEVPFEKAPLTATKHTEGDDITPSDPDWGIVTIIPETATVNSLISKKIKKLTPIKYEDRVRRAALTGLRRYASNLIVSKIKASNLTVKRTLAAIDETTVRDLALAYGGQEGVEGHAVLVLNKKTLSKLGDIRGTNEKKAVYEITADGNPNTGTIKDGGTTVKYCLNANLADDELIYGNMQCFELGLFGDYEIAVYEQTNATKLMLTIVGDVDLGGEVVVNEGFIHASVGGAGA